MKKKYLNTLDTSFEKNKQTKHRTLSCIPSLHKGDRFLHRFPKQKFTRQQVLTLSAIVQKINDKLVRLNIFPITRQHKLEIKNSHKFIRNHLLLFWVLFVSFPLLQDPRGSCNITFRAMVSPASLSLTPVLTERQCKFSDLFQRWYKTHI